MKKTASWDLDGLSLGSFRAKSLVEIEYFDEGGTPRVAGKIEKERRGDSFLCHLPEAKISFSIEFDGNKAVLPVKSVKEEGKAKLKSAVPLPGLLSAEEGESCELFLPLNEGVLCRCAGKPEAEYTLPLFMAPVDRDFANMAVIGALRPDAALGAFLDGGRFDCALRVRLNCGEERRYGVDAVFQLRDFMDDAILDEDVSIHYEALDSGSYVDLAKAYRRFVMARGRIPTLAEKAEGNPALRYSAKAITMRCRLAAKPMPCKVWEQTKETQPPVRKFMSFEDMAKLIEACAKAKAGPIEFQMVGWNYGGHDGAFPQVFPVEAALGGEEEMRKTIARAKELGYPVSVHDCYTGGFSLAENFKLDNVARKHGGVLDTSHQWCGGQCYRWCPQKAYEDYAAKNMPEIAKLGISGSYYVDVISIIQLNKCYHPGHKLDRRESAEYWRRILALQQRLSGASYSEGAREWAIPELDHALLVNEDFDFTRPYFDKRVPFYQIVYHGRLLYNCSRDAINRGPGDKSYLKNIAWGGLPVVYYHQAYTPEIPLWQDFKFDPSRLAEDAALFRRIGEDLEKYSALQFHMIENYVDSGDGLTETLFSNGRRLTANFSKTDRHTAAGAKIAPMGFLVE